VHSTRAFRDAGESLTTAVGADGYMCHLLAWSSESAPEHRPIVMGQWRGGMSIDVGFAAAVEVGTEPMPVASWEADLPDPEERQHAVSLTLRARKLHEEDRPRADGLLDVGIGDMARKLIYDGRRFLGVVSIERAIDRPDFDEPDLRVIDQAARALVPELAAAAALDDGLVGHSCALLYSASGMCQHISPDAIDWAHPDHLARIGRGVRSFDRGGRATISVGGTIARIARLHWSGASRYLVTLRPTVSPLIHPAADLSPRQRQVAGYAAPERPLWRSPRLWASPATRCVDTWLRPTPCWASGVALRWPRPSSRPAASQLSDWSVCGMASDHGECSRGPVSDFRVGSLVADKYRLVQKLGEGGMGVVWLAEQERLRRRVAIKVLKPAYAEHVDAVQRFFSEAKAAARLNHVNVIGILDLDVYRAAPFMVLEYLEGESLAERLRRGAMPWSEAAPIFDGILDALDVAHGAGIIHRDLKPDNLFLSRDSRGRIVPKILDFGIAKLIDASHGALTQTGSLVGTPLYMAPEQAFPKQFGSLGPWTDVWAMGVVIFETLTGRYPIDFELQGPAHAALLQIVNDEIRSLREYSPPVPDYVAFAVDRALSRELQHRSGSARELREQLAFSAAAGFEDTDLPGSPAEWQTEPTVVDNPRVRSSGPLPTPPPATREPGRALPFWLLGATAALSVLGIGTYYATRAIYQPRSVAEAPRNNAGSPTQRQSTAPVEVQEQGVPYRVDIRFDREDLTGTASFSGRSVSVPGSLVLDTLPGAVSASAPGFTVQPAQLAEHSFVQTGTERRAQLVLVTSPLAAVVEVTTEPAGATARLADQVCRTPCTLRIAEGVPDNVELRLSRAGHRTEQLAVARRDFHQVGDVMRATANITLEALARPVRNVRGMGSGQDADRAPSAEMVWY